MEGDFDALYVLGGSFMPMVGNISQLFHQRQPQAPILLTPWARSPQVAASPGPAAARILQVSPYPARRQDGRVNAFLRRFEQRFAYQRGALAISTRQGAGLLNQALASGAQSPAEVKRYLLERREHRTSFGPVRFDAYGDSSGPFHLFPAAADREP